MNDKNGNAIHMGDVVRVEGAAAKAANGLFMVTQTSKSGGDLSLARVKKTGEICIQNAANNQYYPPHCYMSDPWKRRAANEQNKAATVELATVENTAHMAAYWRDREQDANERAENCARHNASDDVAGCRYLAAQYAEIAERLEQTAQPVPEKYTPPLAFTADGLKINGGRVASAHYGIERDDDGTPNAVTIYARDYGADFPREWLDVENDTDSMTDYFDKDHATITPEHPLFQFALFAALAQAAKEARRFLKLAESGKRRTWTDEQENRWRADVSAYEAAKNPGKPTPETFAAITAQREQAKREQEAREEAERAAEAAKVERERTDGRSFIEQTAAAYPIKDGAPYVRVCWSEHPAFYDYADDTLTLSIAAADIILRTFDEQRSAENRGYDKTKITVVLPLWNSDGTDFRHTDRYDLGDGYGGLIGYFQKIVEYAAGAENKDAFDQYRAITDYLEEYTAAGRVVSVEAAPWIDELAAARKKKAEQDAARTAAEIEMLTDDQLVAAVKLSPPYVDAERRNIARAFLQELCSRDRERAYDVFTAWRDGTLNKKEG